MQKLFQSILLATIALFLNTAMARDELYFFVNGGGSYTDSLARNSGINTLSECSYGSCAVDFSKDDSGFGYQIGFGIDKESTYVEVFYQDFMGLSYSLLRSVEERDHWESYKISREDRLKGFGFRAIGKMALTESFVLEGIITSNQVYSRTSISGSYSFQGIEDRNYQSDWKAKGAAIGFGLGASYRATEKIQLIFHVNRYPKDWGLGFDLDQLTTGVRIGF